MRTAITIGITDKGHAEIISHPSVSLHEQLRAFNELGSKKNKFSEIQLWESGRGMRRRNRFAPDKDGGVDFNSAHPVDKQQAKGKKKEKLPDLTPTFGEKGGVNFDAAKPVDQQGKKAKAAKAKKAPKAKAPKSPSPSSARPVAKNPDEGIFPNKSENSDEGPHL